MIGSNQQLTGGSRGQNPDIHGAKTPTLAGAIPPIIDFTDYRGFGPWRLRRRQSHRWTRESFKLEALVIGGKLASFCEVKNLLTF